MEVHKSSVLCKYSAFDNKHIYHMNTPHVVMNSENTRTKTSLGQSYCWKHKINNYFLQEIIQLCK